MVIVGRSDGNMYKAKGLWWLFRCCHVAVSVDWWCMISVSLQVITTNGTLRKRCKISFLLLKCGHSWVNSFSQSHWDWLCWGGLLWRSMVLQPVSKAIWRCDQLAIAKRGGFEGWNGACRSHLNGLVSGYTEISVFLGNMFIAEVVVVICRGTRLIGSIWTIKQFAVSKIHVNGVNVSFVRCGLFHCLNKMPILKVWKASYLEKSLQQFLCYWENPLPSSLIR